MLLLKSARAVLTAGALSLAAFGFAGQAVAASITTDASFDRWMYPFNGTPGVRNLMPTFSAVGAGAFDNRDGQALVGFDTATAGATAGLGASSYQIVSATVSLTHFSGAFIYDDTYDSYLTYDGTLVDSDAGRPIELHGLGFRGGFADIELGPGIPGPPFFEEDGTYAFGPPTAPNVRNVFAANSLGVDVSNNVDFGFESDPWAIGQAVGLNPGDAVVEGVSGVSAGTTFEFEIDLSDPNVVAYLQNGLNSGVLGFAVTSLHTSGMAGGTNPNFYTGDNFDPAAVAPSLTLEFNIVPEPGTGVLALAGLAGLAFLGRKQNTVA